MAVATKWEKKKNQSSVIPRRRDLTQKKNPLSSAYAGAYTEAQSKAEKGRQDGQPPPGKRTNSCDSCLV